MSVKTASRLPSLIVFTSVCSQQDFIVHHKQQRNQTKSHRQNVKTKKELHIKTCHTTELTTTLES